VLQAGGKPKRIGLISALIAANGLFSLWNAYSLATTYPRDLTGAIASGIIGLLLLHRAYALWMLHRSAWAITVAVIALQAALSLAQLLQGIRSPGIWFTVFLLSLGLFYLLTPGVRRLYSARR